MVFSSKCEGKHMYRGVQFAIGTSTVTTETTEHYGDFNLFHLQCRGRSRNFFRRGCTRLLLNFNTSKPHSVFFFSQNTSCIRKLQVISGGGAHPLHPPPRSAPAMQSNMTSQHDWQDKRLTGQLPTLSGHCPLTSHSFEPCIYSCNI